MEYQKIFDRFLIENSSFKWRSLMGISGSFKEFLGDLLKVIT